MARRRTGCGVTRACAAVVECARRVRWRTVNSRPARTLAVSGHNMSDLVLGHATSNAVEVAKKRLAAGPVNEVKHGNDGAEHAERRDAHNLTAKGCTTNKCKRKENGERRVEPPRDGEGHAEDRKSVV